MTDEARGVDANEAPAILFEDQKEFALSSRGLQLVLKKSASEMVQRDVDKFMKRFSEQTQGNSQAEDNGKTLRAALRADWIETLVTPTRVVRNGNDVDELPPAVVRWAAEIIDRVYNKTREVPNA